MTYSLKKSDFWSYDTTVFTSFDAPTHTLTVYTLDNSKAATYGLNIIVKTSTDTSYANYATF